MWMPEKKTRVMEVEYWSCGIDGEGHYHTSEATAIQCKSRQTKMIQGKKPVTFERENTALDMRGQGLTFTAIGKSLGVGGQRASQMVQNAERRKNKEKHLNKSVADAGKYSDVKDVPIELFMDMLSVRSANCLKNMGSCWNNKTWQREKRGETLSTVGDLLKMSDKDILDTQNFGRKSLMEIKTAITDLVEKIKQGKML
jgi:hypothetical protein